MKPVIVYYSFSGNNKYLAEKLHKRLQCDIIEIKEISKRTNFTILLDLLFSRSSKIQQHDIELAEYDNVIFIAPIWAGKIATPLKTYIQQKKKNIRSYAFVSLCSGVPEQKDKIKAALQNLINQPPVAIEELWVNDLLPADKKNTIKYTTPYRIKPEDFDIFEPKIENFLKIALKNS